MGSGFDLSRFIRATQAIEAKVHAAALAAVDQFGEHVLGDAQQLAPVDTGFLQGSGTTEPATIAGGAVEKKIGFGADYAVYVHENLEAQHPVGQAKFLETALRNNQAKLAPFVAARVKAAGGE